MKQIIFIFFLLFSSYSFSQSNILEIVNNSVNEYEKTKIDSTAIELGYKNGEKIKVYTSFKVNSKGEIHDIEARGPHKHFEDEAIRVISQIPPLDPIPNIKEGQSMKFALPITFVVEDNLKKKKKEKIKKQN